MSKLYKYKNDIIKLSKELSLGTKKVKVLGRQALALYDPLEEPNMNVSNKTILEAINKMDIKFTNEIKDIKVDIKEFRLEVNDRFDNLIKKNKLVE